MSADPNQMAQMLAMYRQMFPGGMPQAQAYQNAQAPMQAAMGMGNAPQGTNVGAGGTNALAKLVLAMLARKRMQDYQKQYPQQGTTAMGGSAMPPSAAGGDPSGGSVAAGGP